MKQNITKEQWNELSAKNKIDFWKEIFPDDEIFDNMFVPVVPICRIDESIIGKLIEFLGDDLDLIELNNDWRVCLFNGEYGGKELVDALWEAVKYKLNLLEDK